MVQFEINMKLTTINRKDLNRLIARKETRNSAIAETALQRGGLDATYAVHLIGSLESP